MTESTNNFLHNDPLPIVSVTIEAVNEEGIRSKIGRFHDLAQAEDVLRTWVANQTACWPDGAPIRVSVEFPRRLIFARDLIADASGRVCEKMPVPSERHSIFSSTGLLALHDQVAVAMRLAFASREISVEALQMKRIARIVLAYGDPT